jgi:1-deoxy-D-xylulose-5-phosphate synthase
MGLLEGIKGIEDVKAVPREQLPQLCEEIRRRLIDVVSTTGGHIGASLGVVELAAAVAYVFDSPKDKIVWDVGHQAYTWKLLTGRNDRFPSLRQQGGISGFLRRDESPHDQFGAGHAGTAMSAAFGIAVARDLKHEQYDVVVVVGDGAMTCGLSYEGMNNAGHSGRDIIVILNDNGMSIAPNVGAISRYLSNVATNPLYNRVRDELKRLTHRVDAMVGHGVQDFARRVEESLKNLVLPGVLFQELGLRYFGPVDGHDVGALIEAMEKLRQLKGPRLLHVLTQKGKGFPREEPDLEKFHARAPYDPATGDLRTPASGPPQWTKVFGDAITQLAAEYPSLVAITAAMPSGTGTNIFQKKWPERFFDVGIAEGHATTFAAGLATQGIRPVVAIYSTFLQRAYDNIIHDVAIQKLPVIFCLDRAGMVGDDGQTHMGLYDLAYLLAVPGMTVAAPRDGAELIGLLRCALERTDGPFAIRYPRDKAPAEPPPAAEVAAVPYGTWEVLRQGKGCALLPVGAMCAPALAAADALARDGLDVTVVNCRFVKPVDRAMLETLVQGHRLLVTIEDGVVTNGFGASLAELVQTFAPEVRVVALGAPDRTYEHAPRARQLEWAGLTSDGIAARVRALSAEEAAPVGGRPAINSSEAPPAGSRPRTGSTAVSP